MSLSVASSSLAIVTWIVVFVPAWLTTSLGVYEASAEPANASASAATAAETMKRFKFAPFAEWGRAYRYKRAGTRGPKSVQSPFPYRASRACSSGK